MAPSVSYFKTQILPTRVFFRISDFSRTHLLLSLALYAPWPESDRFIQTSSKLNANEIYFFPILGHCLVAYEAAWQINRKSLVCSLVGELFMNERVNSNGFLVFFSLKFCFVHDPCRTIRRSQKKIQVFFSGCGGHVK